MSQAITPYVKLSGVTCQRIVPHLGYQRTMRAPIRVSPDARVRFPFYQPRQKSRSIMQLRIFIAVLTCVAAAQAAALATREELTKLARSGTLDRRFTCVVGVNTFCNLHCYADGECKGHCAKKSVSFFFSFVRRTVFKKRR
jgi:hypothetical protein